MDHTLTDINPPISKQDGVSAFLASIGRKQMPIQVVLRSLRHDLTKAYVIRNDALVQDDCDALVERLTNGGRKGSKPQLCRRWSIDCDETRPLGWGHSSLFKSDTDQEFVKKKGISDGNIVISNTRSRADPILRRLPDSGSTGEYDLGHIETAHIPLSVGEYRNLGTVGLHGWFQNRLVDTSFELLERALDCEKHNIALCTTTYAFNLYVLGDMNKANSSPYEKQLESKLRGKDFIVLPISEAYTDMIANETSLINAQPLNNDSFEEDNRDHLSSPVVRTYWTGKHWSALVIDCRGDRLDGRLLDSRCGNSRFREPNIFKTGAQVLFGVDRVFRYLYPTKLNTRYSKYTAEPNAPNQENNNLAGDIDSDSACGPFIWAITKEITQYIIDCREDPNFATPPDSIRLSKAFKDEWNWDSMHTRMTIQRLI